MTFPSLAALFGAMVVLAAAPSLSVMLVTAKSAASGFAHGAAAAMGVVAGDVLLILVAVFGLALLAEATGSAWLVLKYAAAAYLVWLAVRLWRSRTGPDASSPSRHTSLPGSFLAGLLLTLADQKAVLFYLAFLPAFVDLSAVTWVDVSALVAVTTVAVGGVKVAYAYAGERARALVTPAMAARLNALAAAALLLAAGALILRG